MSQYGTQYIIYKLNKRVGFAGPSSVVRILGFTEVPKAGSTFFVCENEKQAKQYSLEYSNNKNFDALIKSGELMLVTLTHWAHWEFLV